MPVTHKKKKSMKRCVPTGRSVGKNRHFFKFIFMNILHIHIFYIKFTRSYFKHNIKT
jgi:hypothetical protein